MRKREILKHFPKKNDYRKEAESKGKLAARLAEDADRAHQIFTALRDITIHNEFPVQLKKYPGGIEILSGCDEVCRSAYVKPTEEGKRYVVTTYKNEKDDTDGTPVEGAYAKAAALQIAKDFVATGRKAAPPQKKAAPRGRNRSQ